MMEKSVWERYRKMLTMEKMNDGSIPYVAIAISSIRNTNKSLTF